MDGSSTGVASAAGLQREGQVMRARWVGEFQGGRISRESRLPSLTREREGRFCRQTVDGDGNTTQSIMRFGFGRGRCHANDLASLVTEEKFGSVALMPSIFGDVRVPLIWRSRRPGSLDVGPKLATPIPWTHSHCVQQSCYQEERSQGHRPLGLRTQARVGGRRLADREPADDGRCSDACRSFFSAKALGPHPAVASRVGLSDLSSMFPVHPDQQG